MALAFGLEAAQQFAPGRHAHLADAMVKAFGGVTGVAGYQLMFPLRRLILRLSIVGDPGWALAPIYVTSR
jgi:VanZ family protein